MPNLPVTSVDVVVDILQGNLDLAYVTFATYQSKAIAQPDSDLISLQQKLLHHKENNDYQPISRHSLSKEIIAQMCSEAYPAKCLAIRSNVVTSSCTTKFIPMLDFTCSENRQFLIGLLSILNHHKELGMGGGFLLETTKSYHYYGRKLLLREKWEKFIGLSLLCHPPPEYLLPSMHCDLSTVIDARFLGHCLIAGQGSLRISANPNGDLPNLVAMID